MYLPIYWLCWVFIAAWAFSPAASSGSSSLLVVRRLLVAVASLVEHKALGHEGSSSSALCLQRLWLLGTRVQPQKLWCMGLVARGIFPHQGSIPCVLHWPVDSLPLSHQGSHSSFFPCSVSVSVNVSIIQLAGKIQIPAGIPKRSLFSLLSLPTANQLSKLVAPNV